MVEPTAPDKQPPQREFSFDDLAKWSDDDLRDLLCYVSKKDLAKALKTSSLSVQNTLARNIPPAVWQDLVQQAQQLFCSEEESHQAQDKFMHLAELLKEDH